jgi:uncharacterized protein (DUF362 family)
MRLTRRQMLASLGASLTRPCFGLTQQVPTAPVAIAKCASYGPELLGVLERMFDQLGGLGRLVKGKTVAVKLNLTGLGTYRMGYTPVELAQWTHYRVIGATVHLLGKAGAKRIRLLESPWATTDPVEEYMLEAGWEPRDILGAAPAVEFENTNYLGRGQKYSRFPVPHGGLLFSAYDLNHSYEDCDVFVSLAKLKEHATAGITLSMKNCFGIIPCTIYGDGAGIDEPGLAPRGGRGPMHSGYRQPSKSSPPEIDPSSPRDGGYRIPRAVADLVAARPIHLAVIDGIETMAGGEGPWIQGVRPVKPGVLIAGTNCVTTDAVATAVMGFDPMAERDTAPFEGRDNTLRLAERLGVGTCDLRRIEVVGTPIREAVFEFSKKNSPADRAAIRRSGAEPVGYSATAARR